MINYISKLFIDNYDDYNNPKVRSDYGILSSVISIVLNSILVICKITIGLFTNSIAIINDGLNNLSDTGSNIATLVAFKMSHKHPDKEHPFGHGRYEYVAGLVIAFLIIAVGIQSLIQSVTKIINPETVKFSYLSLIILLIAIFIKLIMYLFNLNIGKKINSTTLKAAAIDSRNDMLITGSTIIALIFSGYVSFPLDGIIGLIVSGLIIYAGIELFRETLGPIIGEAPDPVIVKQILDIIAAEEIVLDYHDLLVHDYGVGHKFLSIHVEVDSTMKLLEAHDVVDNLERLIYDKYGYMTTIHLDPIVIDDSYTSTIYEDVKKIVKKINKFYDVNDFRIVEGESHCNYIFDIAIPAFDEIDHDILKDKVQKEVRKSKDNVYCVIKIIHKTI